MKAPTLRRIAAHSGSSLGSNTIHWVPRRSDSSMNSAVRRTGMYFHCDPTSSAPSQVRAPQITGPYNGSDRRQLTANGLALPLTLSSTWSDKLAMPEMPTAVPAGAFHTPRAASVAAHSPATAPHGALSTGV